jgi:hypothetical protein
LTRIEGRGGRNGKKSHDGNNHIFFLNGYLSAGSEKNNIFVKNGGQHVVGLLEPESQILGRRGGLL